MIAQSVKPYLQNAQPTSIYINWKTDNGTDPQVQYGTTSGMLTMIQNGSTENLEPKDSDYSTVYNYHTVKLTGLTPDTGYYYTVTSGTESSTEYYFRTPPAPGTKKDKLRFIALGDHQLINREGQPYLKYNELVQASKAKAEELYGTPIADHFQLIVNDGDQVDLGKLEHYEEIHFQKSSYLTPELPIITAVGNHETFGTSYSGGAIQSYFDHFVLDDGDEYNSIDSNTERFYAYQLDNILFVVLDTELESNAQANWFQNVITSAASDANVDWVVTICHRPYEAEQYSNDFSSWFGNTILPMLEVTDKYVLHIAGHHHMYSRGQLLNHNAYHMISGGTAWPQYWGDSGNEDDRDETQGSWSQFAYQLVEFDNVAEKMTIQSYTIGSLENLKANVLLDEVSYQKGIAGPDKPYITNDIQAPIALPFTFYSSAYVSSTLETHNSVHYQISPTNDFSIITLEKYQHIDNWYGPLNGQNDETENIGLGADGVLEYTIPENFLNNGDYSVRVRHRDHNLGWSEWSDPIAFTVTGSIDGEPSLTLNKPYYALDEDINITFLNGPQNSTDWIGIYDDSDVPGSNGSTDFQYVDGDASGIKTFTLGNQGIYFAGFFENNGYNELTPRQYFWVGANPTLTSDLEVYDEGDDVIISYTNHPNNATDYIAIFKVGQEPELANATQTLDISTTNTNITFSGLPKGYYYAVYNVKGTDADVIAGEQVNFQVGQEIATITLEKTTFSKGEPISITFEDGPGIEKDYIGFIIDDNDNEPNDAEGYALPTTETLWTYRYFNGLVSGTTTVTGTDYSQGGPNQLPDVGEYWVAMFTNDSYEQVSNRIKIVVNENPAIFTDKTIFNQGETVTVGFVNAPGNAKDWIGLYAIGDVPGTDGSTTFQYLDMADGSTVAIDGSVDINLASGGEYFLQMFENDGYTELADRITIQVRELPVLGANSPFETSDNVIVNLTSGGLANVMDWVGLYPVGTTPNASNLIQRIDVITLNQQFNFGTLAEGLYFVAYHTKDSFDEVGDRLNVQVGSQVINLSTDDSDYYIGLPIEFIFTAGATNGDMISIYNEGDDPSTDASVTYLTLTDGSAGTISLDGTSGNTGGENVLPQVAGNYFAVVLANADGSEISNQVVFSLTVRPTLMITDTEIVAGDPIVVSYAAGPGNDTDWVGIYDVVVDIPDGSPVASAWAYVNNSNGNTYTDGEITLDRGPEGGVISTAGNYYITFLENDGYNELAARIPVTVVSSTLSTNDFDVKKGIEIYPNPTEGLIYIKSDSMIQSVAVFMLDGKLLNSNYQIGNKDTTINLRKVAGSANGMYLIKIQTEKGTKTFKMYLK